MTAKGYPRKAENNIKSGKTWYIPHHGVVHLAKLGKVRAVFDCSTEYRGTSLKKQLILGPQLTNQLVGVLKRFREEQVAFIVDVEAASPSKGTRGSKELTKILVVGERRYQESNQRSLNVYASI